MTNKTQLGGKKIYSYAKKIKGEACFLDKNGIPIKRVENLYKVTDRLSFSKHKERYFVFYYSNGTWYLMSHASSEVLLKKEIEYLEAENITHLLRGIGFLAWGKHPYSSIWRELYYSILKDKKHTLPAYKKLYKIKAGKKTTRGVVYFRNKYRSLHVEEEEVKYIGNGLYKDCEDGPICILYYEYKSMLYALGAFSYSAVYSIFCDTCLERKITKMIEDGRIDCESALLLYEKLTMNTIEEYYKNNTI